MTHDTAPLVYLGAAWIAYFALHSLLASTSVKARVGGWRPALLPAYRLVYNAVAVITLLPVAWLLWRYPGPALWTWSGGAAWVADGLALAAVGGFALTLRSYDGSEFLGVRQWRLRDGSVRDQGRLALSPLHRFVRHPWYALALVIVWTRNMDAARLLSAIMVTMYFVVGSRLEEGRLMACYGARYRRYRERVPGLVPLPGRFLSAREAERLGTEEPADEPR